MTTTYVCPHCDAEYRDADHFIAHRFLEIAKWFDSTGENENANAYRAKNPTHYRIVNGIIERKVP